MAYNYSCKVEENMAKAVGKGYPVSTKVSIEICNFLRGKEVAKAKRLLEEVITMKRAVPYKRFTNGPGHKTGMSSGRFPIKASDYFLKLLKSAEANAQFKGLNVNNLYIHHLSAQQGGKQHHYGRHRGRIFKNSHIEMVVIEKAKKVAEKPKSEKKETKQ